MLKKKKICCARGITNDHILQFLGTVSKPEVPDGKVQLFNKNNCPLVLALHSAVRGEG